MYSISSCIRKFADNHPLRAAIVANDTEITYAELYETIKVVDRALRKIELTEKSVVAIIAFKELSTVQFILGALHAGVTVVPINPLLKSSQLLHILQDSKASILVCKRNTVNAIRNQSDIPLFLKSIVITDDKSNGLKKQDQSAATEYAWEDFLNADFPDTTSKQIYTESLSSQANKPAVLLYTSGSTGRPKGVILTQQNLYFGAASISEYLNNTDADRILALMPFSFDYGLSQLTSAMYTGATLVLFDYLVPRGVIDTVVRQKITGLPAVPHVWNQLAMLNWPEVEHLRYLTSTGGRLQKNTIRKLEQVLPTTSIYSMYGFTEAFRATYLPPEQLSIRPESIGRAVPHAQVLVVDASGNELPPGEVGELIQSGPLVTAGYWQDARATELKFRPRRMSTGMDQIRFAWSGDLAYTDEEGYLYFVSRMDDQIKINGYRLTTTEIELTISACPFIREITIICVQHDGTDHKVIAFVTLSSDVEKDALLGWCKKEMPGYMVPSEFIILDVLPVNPNRKIDKTALLNIYEKQYSGPTT